MKLEIGQKIFVEVFGRRCPAEIKECQIEKIGNKYFYLDKYPDKGFDKQTLKYTNKEYTQHNLQGYLTTQEITDRHEKARLREVLRKQVALPVAISRKYCKSRLLKPRHYRY